MKIFNLLNKNIKIKYKKLTISIVSLLMWFKKNRACGELKLI